MATDSKKTAAGKISLFAAAVIWGSSFFMMKNAVGVFPIHILLGIRFTAAFFLLLLIFFKKIKYVTKEYVLRSAVLGALLFLAYSLQTIGITGTTPGKNAFLTAVYCVFVPFLYWIVNRDRPDEYEFVSAALCVAGIGLISLTGRLSIEFGDLFTLIGGFFFACHLVALSKCTKGYDPVLLTILQFGMAALFAWAVGLCFESLPTEVSAAAVGELVYLSLFPTAVAMLLQSVGQKYVRPPVAALILCLEAVFGVLFSVIFYKEQLTVRIVSGFLLILCAMVLSQTKLSFLPAFRSPR